METQKTIFANGRQYPLEREMSLSRFLIVLKLEQKGIAVELNGEIVVRSTYSQTRLHQGDSLEIITCVGGG